MGEHVHGERAAAGEIRILVNGRDRTVREGTTVRDLLIELELVPALVVVEHNLEILDRGRFETVLLEEGDRLELVHFVGGGALGAVPSERGR